MPNQSKPPTPEKKVDKDKGKVNTLAPEKKGDKDKGKMVMNLISHDQIERSLNEGSTCMHLWLEKLSQRPRCKSQDALN